MRKRSKLTLFVLTILCVLTCAFGLVACGGTSAKQAIEMYILPQDSTIVSEDFTLPKKIGKDDSVKVTWESSHEAIKIEDGTNDTYTAKVTLQSEVTDVTLTIKAGGAKKAFTVRVDELNVYTFLSYKFPKKGASVSEDFDLDTSYTIQGETAEIAWSIDAAYQDYITLNAEKNKVLVTPGEDLVAVKIKATFKFGGEEAPQEYSFSVAPILEHKQIVNRMYSESEYPVDLSGYIVHLTEASADYGNATFFMVDEDMCCGYYVYRVSINKSDVAKFQEGAYVTVTGAKATCYSGLWETTQKTGTAVIDETKEKIDPRSTVYDFDTDLLSGVPSAIWHQSQFVRLNGWKVESKASSKPKVNGTDTQGELFTLSRGGTKIAVYISKYITRTDAERTALCDVYDQIEVGNYVTVTGLLGNHDGAQLQPVVAGDIVKVDAEGTNENAPKIKKAVEAVEKQVAANFASMIIANKEVTMPTSEEGVAISYRVAGAQNPTVVISDDGKFTVTPIDSEKNYDIEVTYKIGDYTGYGFFKLQNWKQDSAGVVAIIKAAITEAGMADVKTRGQYALPAPETYGATVTWEVVGTKPAWLNLTEKNVEITDVPLVAAAKVTLKATIALDDVSDTVEITFNVAAETFYEATAVPTGESVLSAVHKGERLYVTGTTVSSNKNYFSTDTDPSKAAKLTIAQATDGYTIKIGDKFVEVGAGSNNNGELLFVDTASEGAVWTWNDTMKIFTFTVKDVDTYYIGTYDSSSFTTVGVSKLSYIWDADKSAAKAVLNVTQHPAHFGTPAAVFTELSEPQEGEFVYSAVKKGNRLYASALTLDKGDEGYIQTTTDASKAVKFKLEKNGTTGWYIKMGEKYLEINPYENNNKTSYKLKLVATPTAEWTWFADGRCFQQAATELTGDDPKTNNFYVGTYDSSSFDTLSPSNVSYITGSNAANLDVSQHPARFGTVSGGTSVVPGESTGGEETLPTEKTITFGTAGDQQEGASGNQVVYQNNGYTFTCKKAESSTDLRFDKDADHFRLYQGSTIELTCATAFNKVIFVVTDSSYVSPLEASLKAWTAPAGVTVTVTTSGTMVTVTFSQGITTLGPVSMTKQVRVASLTAYAVSAE